jgi:hypothetical protein
VRLSDIMGNMDLAVYPILALVLFVGVFVLVTGRAMRTSRATHERWSRIPLDHTGTVPGPNQETNL